MDRFRTEAAPRGLLVSLRAGGVGLNLGEATHVVIFDRWWNPAVEVQAIYRAHRFDREEPLHVIRFLVADSIEERIEKILERKECLFDEIIESAETRTYRFTKEELMQILELTTGDIFLTHITRTRSVKMAKIVEYKDIPLDDPDHRERAGTSPRRQ